MSDIEIGSVYAVKRRGKFYAVRMERAPVRFPQTWWSGVNVVTGKSVYDIRDYEIGAKLTDPTIDILVLEFRKLQARRKSTARNSRNFRAALELSRIHGELEF
jgi:hypothetical protein